MARRARRATAKVDYAKLNGDVSDDDADDFVDGRLLYHAMMDYSGYKQENAVQVLSPQAVNTAWLAGSHLQVPALVHKSHGGLDKLGLELPTAPDSSKPITVERLMCELGLEQEVSTLDVATRSDGPRWMLHQWGQYWTVRRCISVKTHKGKVRKGRKGKRLHVGEDDEAESSRIHPSIKQAEEAERSAGQEHEESEQRGIMGSVQSVGTGPLAKGISNDARRKILEIVALPLIGTAIGNRIHPPYCVEACHIVPKVCPAGWAHAQEMGLGGGLVANVAVSGAYVDFRFARGGAAMWLHVVSGKKAFCCVPPTSMNLAAYVSWLNTEQRNASFFAALAEDAALIEVHAGETLFLPAGWLFAQATIDDAFLLSGTFLHAGALRGVLRVMDVEDCLQMPRLQAQEELLWFTAMHISQELVRYVGRAKHAEVLSRVRAEKALKMKELVALEALTGAGREPVGVLEDAPGRDRGPGRGTVVQLGRKRARSPGPDAASGKRRPGEAAGASAGGAHGEERERAAEQAGMPRKVVLKVPQQAGPPKSQAAAGAKPARKPQEGGAHTQPGASKAPSLTVKLGDKGKSAAASTPKRASLMVKLGDRKAGPTLKTPSLTVKLGDKAKKGGSLPDGDAGPAPAGAPQAPLTVKLGAGTQSSKPAAGATASTLKPPLTVRLGTAKAEAKPAPPSLKVTLQAAGSPSKQKVKAKGTADAAPKTMPQAPTLKVKLGATVGDKEQVAADPGDAAAARAAEAVKLEQSASAALSAALAGRKTKVKLQPKGIAQSTKTTVHSPGKATPQTGVKEKDTARNASPQDGLEGEDVPGEATPRVGGKVEDASKDATQQADLEGTGAGETPTLPDGMNEEDTPGQDHPPVPSEPTPEAFLKVEETPGKLTPKEGLKEEHAAEETGPQSGCQGEDTQSPVAPAEQQAEHPAEPHQPPADAARSPPEHGAIGVPPADTPCGAAERPAAEQPYAGGQPAAEASEAAPLGDESAAPHRALASDSTPRSKVDVAAEGEAAGPVEAAALGQRTGSRNAKQGGGLEAADAAGAGLNGANQSAEPLAAASGGQLPAATQAGEHRVSAAEAGHPGDGERPDGPTPGVAFPSAASPGRISPASREGTDAGSEQADAAGRPPQSDALEAETSGGAHGAALGIPSSAEQAAASLWGAAAAPAESGGVSESAAASHEAADGVPWEPTPGAGAMVKAAHGAPTLRDGLVGEDTPPPAPPAAHQPYPPAGHQPPSDSARSPPERGAQRPAEMPSGSAEQHASERRDDNGQPTAEAAAKAPLRPHCAVPTATPAPESPNSAAPAAGREGAVRGAAQIESAQDASTQAGEEAGAGAPGEDGAAEREAGDGAAGEAQLRGGGGSGADVAMEDVPGSLGGDRDNSVPEMAGDATAAGHHLEGEREGDGGGALPSDGAGLAEGEEVGQPAAEALDGGSHPMQAPSAPAAQPLAGGTAPSGDAPPAPRPAPVKRVDIAKGRPGTQSKPHTAPQGEVLIALGRSRVVSRVPSRPLMAAALEVAQQAGEGGAPRPRPAPPTEGGPTARQPQPQPGAAGKQRASAGDGGAAPADVAGRVAALAAPRPPEPAGRPVLAASVGSGREAGGAGDGGAVPATAAGEEQLAAPAAALDRTPSKPKREAFLGDAEAGVRIREVDDSMLGPWPREDVLALLAALKASLRLLPDGVPRQLARPQELLEELEAGLVCVGADVDADADAPDSELRALAESITLDLKAAPLPSALPKWEIYDDAEAIEEACDNSQLAVVGSPRGDGDSAFEIRQQPGLRRSESLTQTAKALRKPGQAGAPGKGAGGAGGSGRPPVGGTQPKKHAPKSVKDRLKKKLRIR